MLTTLSRLSDLAPIFGESPQRGGQRFVALGGYRMVFSEENEATEFFSLASDPLELQNVADGEEKRSRS